MNRFESDPVSWTESEIDLLLKDFFRREIPEPLRELPTSRDSSATTRKPPPTGKPPPTVLKPPPTVLKPAPAVVKPPPAVLKPFRMGRQEQRSTTTGFIGLLFAALGLLMAVTALWSPVGQSSDRPVGVVVDAPPAVPPVSAIGEEVTLPQMESIVIERIEEHLERLERMTYDTDRGPVEQRTNVFWTNVTGFEPESGAQVEMMIPELSIEIFEIDGE